MTAVDRIASVCHEANRAYCKSLGDNSQPTWEDAPEWQTKSAREGVLFHIANPDAGPEHSHESWLRLKSQEGWAWGPEKDPEAKKHPCYCPYDQLPPEQRFKDTLFLSIVHAFIDKPAHQKKAGPKTRKMRFFHTEKKVDPETGVTSYVRVLDGEGNFIQYSQDHLEYENGAGMYPVAIIETPDGKVHSIAVDYVKFVMEQS